MWKNAARGNGELASSRSMVSDRTPCLARNAAAESPTNPPPAISTGASSVMPSVPLRRRPSRPAPADDEGLIVEPQTAVALQDGLGRLQVTTRVHHRIQSFVFDLVDVDCRVPRREQRGGADAIADLRGQGVHVVTEYRFVVRLRAEGKLARFPPQLGFQRRDQLMSIDPERVLSRPQSLDDFERGVPAV